MTYARDPERVEKSVRGKFCRHSQNHRQIDQIDDHFSLLTLPLPFQAALQEGKIGLTQGYILAANLANPKLYQIFDAILKKPVTNEELTKLLEKAAGSDGETKPRAPFSGFYSNIKTVRTAFEKGKAAFARQDIEKLVAELKDLCTLLEEQAQKQAAEAVAKKKSPG